MNPQQKSSKSNPMENHPLQKTNKENTCQQGPQTGGATVKASMTSGGVDA